MSRPAPQPDGPVQPAQPPFQNLTGDDRALYPIGAVKDLGDFDITGSYRRSAPGYTSVPVQIPHGLMR